ncbi:MAG TPA: hypothetical protein VFZ76_00290 [Anaerolineales bacterium]
MNHIVVSEVNYRLFAGTLDECKDFAKDWAIKNKRSPKIVSERAFVGFLESQERRMTGSLR